MLIQSVTTTAQGLHSIQSHRTLHRKPSIPMPISIPTKKPPTTPPPSTLPRILCLHGGGTSALIFKIQTRRISYALRHHFHFVFVDAPFNSGPGPGVLPVFQDCGPYYQWVYPANQLLGQQRVRQVLRDAIAKDGGKFVGVLGFSQGGRQSSGLLADLQNGEDTGLPNWDFGVLLCASYPPLSMELARKSTTDTNQGIKPEFDSHGEIREVEEHEIIRIPSVHVRGTLDVHLEKGRRLERFFDEREMETMEFVMGHHLPGAAGDVTSGKGDTDLMKEAVLRVYEKAGRGKGKGVEMTGEMIEEKMRMMDLGRSVGREFMA